MSKKLFIATLVYAIPTAYYFNESLHYDPDTALVGGIKFAFLLYGYFPFIIICYFVFKSRQVK